MRPFSALSFLGEEERVQIQAKVDYELEFLGASDDPSVDPSSIRLNSFAVGSPETGEEGVVAVILHSKNVKTGMLLRVYHVQGKVKIDKDYEWMPPEGAKVRVSREGLEVTIEGEKFGTSSFGVRTVDGNTLCRYLANPCEETANAVRAAASEVLRKKTLEEELETARAKIRELKKALGDEESRRVRCQQHYESAMRTVDFQEDVIATFIGKTAEFREIADRKWYKGRRIFDFRFTLPPMERAFAKYREDIAKGEIV